MNEVRFQMSDTPLTIRAVAARDLAGRPTPGRMLLGERNGRPVATIALTSGALAADARNATAQDLHLLRFARYRTVSQAADRWPVRSLRVAA
jgi:hypothetical protein